MPTVLVVLRKLSKVNAEAKNEIIKKIELLLGIQDGSMSVWVAMPCIASSSQSLPALPLLSQK